MKPTDVLTVMAGAAVGGGLRFVLGSWIATRAGSTFPWHTLAINVSGAFLLGVLMAVTAKHPAASNVPRLLLGIGLLGGYTTFSTFAYETVVLAEEGFLARAAGYFAASGVAAVLATVAGLAIGRRL